MDVYGIAWFFMGSQVLLQVSGALSTNYHYFIVSQYRCIINYYVQHIIFLYLIVVLCNKFVKRQLFVYLMLILEGMKNHLLSFSYCLCKIKT
jgi:hypothetical protein